jgi:hypothetical protein
MQKGSAREAAKPQGGKKEGGWNPVAKPDTEGCLRSRSWVRFPFGALVL